MVGGLLEGPADVERRLISVRVKPFQPTDLLNATICMATAQSLDDRTDLVSVNLLGDRCAEVADEPGGSVSGDPLHLA